MHETSSWINQYFVQDEFRAYEPDYEHDFSYNATLYAESKIISWELLVRVPGNVFHCN